MLFSYFAPSLGSRTSALLLDKSSFNDAYSNVDAEPIVCVSMITAESDRRSFLYVSYVAVCLRGKRSSKWLLQMILQYTAI